LNLQNLISFKRLQSRDLHLVTYIRGFILHIRREDPHWQINWPISMRLAFMTATSITGPNELLNQLHPVNADNQSSNVTFEEVGAIFPSNLPESGQLNRTSNRQSLPFEPSKTINEHESSTSTRLSDVGNAAARRPTSYNGPNHTQSATTTKIRHSSSFSTASFASLQTLESYYTTTSYVESRHTVPSIVENDSKQGKGFMIRRSFRKLLQSNGLAFQPLLEDKEEADDEYD